LNSAWLILADLLGVIIAAIFYLPVYYDLGVTSVYQYLELRFGKTSRSLSTIIFMVQSLLYNGIVIYAPALALEQVAGMGLQNFWLGQHFLTQL